MTDTLTKEIEEAQEKLRAIDGNISALHGRPARSGFEVTSDVSGRRDVRRRPDYEDLPPKRALRNDDDLDLPRKSLASQVVMPAIETKSRDSAITEMREKEATDVKQRNRRLFGSLLVGTLKRFKNDETKISTAEKAQAEKVASVEKRLEEQKREDREKMFADKDKLMIERREQEKALRALQRKKALMQYAEEKTAHYRRLQNFIATKTTPSLFFLPAKHTLQSLEMLKHSAARLQDLIASREAQLEKELEGGELEDDVEEDKGLRSHVAKLRRRDIISPDGDEGEEEEEVEEEEQKDVERNGTIRVEVKLKEEDSEDDAMGDDDVEVKMDDE